MRVLLVGLLLSSPALAEPGLLAHVERLRDADDWQQRMEAALALGRSGDFRARKPLLRALDDPHYAVRAAAIRALALAGDLRAAPSILELLADDEPFVRLEAEKGLARFDPLELQPYLLHALAHHPDSRIQLAVIERLAQHPEPHVLEALLEATGSGDELARMAVGVILERPRAQAVALFTQGLTATDYGVQVASVTALGSLNATESVEPILSLLDSRVPEVSLAATETLRTLSPAIDRSQHLVRGLRGQRFERARSLKILGILGGEEANLILLNALEDPDVLIRGAAVAGLGASGDRRAIPKLEIMKKNEDNARIISLIRGTLAQLLRREEPAVARATKNVAIPNP